MARYIDVDKVLKELPDDLPYKASVKRVLMQAPEADVVESNEKHIPKKLKVEVVPGRNVRSLYYYCPSCNGFRMETAKHCSNCGQALDWKETFLEYGLEKAYKNWEKLVEESEGVKVKHGKWKECFEDWRKQIAGDECSVCGFQHYGTSIAHYNYCPNCGAKMDGGTSDGQDNAD